MLKSTELRDQSSLHLQEADQEDDLYLRRSITNLAFDLAQLAEKTEREEVHIKVIADTIAWNRQQQQQPGFAPLEAELAARKIIEQLMSAGYRIVPV